MNKPDASPEFFIQLPCQRFHKRVVFLSKHFFFPLFHDFNLVAVRFLFIERADTFDDMIAFFRLYDAADFTRSEVKRRLFKSGIHLAFSDGTGAFFPLL